MPAVEALMVGTSPRDCLSSTNGFEETLYADGNPGKIGSEEFCISSNVWTASALSLSTLLFSAELLRSGLVSSKNNFSLTYLSTT